MSEAAASTLQWLALQAFGRALHAEKAIEVNTLKDGASVLRRYRDAPDLAKAALRCVMCNDQMQFQRFDELFDRYFLQSLSSLDWQVRPQMAQNRIALDPSVRGHGDPAGVDLQAWFDRENQVLSETLISDWLASMSKRINHRQQRRSARGKLDIRATLRHPRNRAALQHIAYRRRPTQPPTWLMAIDVSQSMEGYSLVYLLLASALKRLGVKLRVFCFDSRFLEISEVLNINDPKHMRFELSKLARFWGGGTLIAESLRGIAKHIQRTPNSYKMIIFSDAKDADHVEALDLALRQLQRHTRRLIWVSPRAFARGRLEDSRRLAVLNTYSSVHESVNNLQQLSKLAGQL